jgi:hypothetical protein
MAIAIAFFNGFVAFISRLNRKSDANWFLNICIRDWDK